MFSMFKYLKQSCGDISMNFNEALGFKKSFSGQIFKSEGKSKSVFLQILFTLFLVLVDFSTSIERFQPKLAATEEQFSLWNADRFFFNSLCFAQEAFLVDCEIATFSSMNPKIKLMGTFIPVWKADLAGKIGGRIKKIYAEIGEEIASGEIAFSFEDEDAKLAVEAAEAAVVTAQKKWEELKAGVRKEEIERLEAIRKEAEAFFQQVQAEKKRLEQLFQNQVITAAQWDDIVFKERMAAGQLGAAEAALKAAKSGPTAEQLGIAAANLAQAKVQVKQAKRMLEECFVRVPRKCKVVSRLRDVGEVAVSMPQEAVLRVVTLDPIKIRFHIGEDLISQVKVGDPVFVKLPGVDDELRCASISVKIPFCDEVTRRVPCEAVMENRDEAVIPGQSAEVILSLPPKNGIMLPRTAIIDSEQGKGVFVVEGNQAKFYPIKEIAVADGSVLIEGISPGSKVVTRGALGLRNGAIVSTK